MSNRQAPLVYVDRRAQQRARRILGGCPEVEIAEAITQGSLRFENGVALIRGPGWEATAVRGPGVVRRTPRAWHVTDITRKHQIPTREE